MRWLIRIVMARFVARIVRELLTRFSQSAAHGQARNPQRSYR
ncbi:MAG: hypothetical protein QOF57_558 [Frankiaceae bacterium]|jgi:hypothetical protein|nr:hypothetical protein [Frankiaceae bacterium]